MSSSTRSSYRSRIGSALPATSPRLDRPSDRRPGGGDLVERVADLTALRTILNADQLRSRAAASRSASSTGVGSSPNISVVALESTTNGAVNWYRVVRNSFTIGANSPKAHSTGYGIAVTLAAGAPLTSVNLVASCRTVSAGPV